MIGESNDALLEKVRGEREDLELARFDHGVARVIGETAADLARDGEMPIVVRVTRGEQIAFHASFAGTTADHDDWVRRKANSARRFEVPTLELVLRRLATGRELDWLDPREFAVASGAVPLFVDRALVGVIAVSGLVGSIVDDHDVAMRAIRTAGLGGR